MIGYAIVYFYPWILSGVPELYVSIMCYYLTAGFFSCLLARLIIAHLFNPKMWPNYQIVLHSMTALTLLTGVAVVNQGEHNQAFSTTVDAGSKHTIVLRQIEVKG